MGRWVELGGRFREIVRREIQDADEKMRLYKKFLASGPPPESETPPGSSRLKDWMLWLDRLGKPGR
jgi:hypothetical protein